MVLAFLEGVQVSLINLLCIKDSSLQILTIWFGIPSLVSFKIFDCQQSGGLLVKFFTGFLVVALIGLFLDCSCYSSVFLLYLICHVF